jgi:hypothetical protein
MQELPCRNIGLDVGCHLQQRRNGPVIQDRFGEATALRRPE